jgi:PHS family inorganic phosphate transporter-like MFS transporter
MSSSLGIERGPLGTRAKLVLSIFSNFGLGAFTSTIVYLILLTAFKNTLEKNIKHLEWVWRLLLGIGLIPAFGQLYARLTMRETTPYLKCE